MAFKKADIIASAKKYGPKYAGKISMYINKNRTYIDANGNEVIDDDYKYNIGIRKMALYDYQSRDKFYKGN